MQVRGAFDAALEALQKAGAVLIDFSVGLMLAEQNRNAPDFFTYDYEMPREIARSCLYPGLLCFMRAVFLAAPICGCLLD